MCNGCPGLRRATSVMRRMGVPLVELCASVLAQFSLRGPGSDHGGAGRGRGVPKPITWVPCSMKPSAVSQECNRYRSHEYHSVYLPCDRSCSPRTQLVNVHVIMKHSLTFHTSMLNYGSCHEMSSYHVSKVHVLHLSSLEPDRDFSSTFRVKL